MKGVPFKDANKVFGKPSEMTDDECNSLPVKITTNDKYPAIESVWEMSDEELAMINKSKRIRNGVLGRGLQPMYVTSEQNEIE